MANGSTDLIEIRLFGNLTVIKAGENITGRFNDRQRAMLGVLALCGAGGMNTKTLHETICSNLETRGNFNTLTANKTHINKHTGCIEPELIILCKGDTGKPYANIYKLNFAENNIRVDVAEFDQATAKPNVEDSGYLLAVAQEYKRGKLWEDAPVFVTTEWIENKRKRCEAAYHRMLPLLIAHVYDEGTEQEIELCLEWDVDAHPADEQKMMRLMKHYVFVSKFKDAVFRYSIFQTRLLNVGQEPSAEIVRLDKEIQNSIESKRTQTIQIVTSSTVAKQNPSITPDATQELAHEVEAYLAACLPDDLARVISCLGRARTAEQQLGGLKAAEVIRDLETHIDIYRVALKVCQENSSFVTLGLQLAKALAPFFDVSGRWPEGRQWLDSLLEQARQSEPSYERASALNKDGILAMLEQQYEVAYQLFAESLEVAQVLSETHQRIRAMADVYSNFGFFHRCKVHPDEIQAMQSYEQALLHYEQVGEQDNIFWPLLGLGDLKKRAGQLDEALANFMQGLAISERLGDTRNIAYAKHSLGTLAQTQGMYSWAFQLYKQSLETMTALPDMGSTCVLLEAFAKLAIEQQQWQRASILYGAATSLRKFVCKPRWEHEQTLHTTTIQRIAAFLDTSETDEVWAECWIMPDSLPKAVEFAVRSVT